MPEWGELIERDGEQVKYFPIHEGQRDILLSDARFSLILSGVSAGKTTSGALWLAMQIEKKPWATFLVVTPTYKVMHQTTLPTFLNTVAGTALQGDYQAGKERYQLPGGGVIYFRSAETEKSLHGVQLTGAVWGDEFGNVSAQIWHVVQQRTALRQCPCLFTTTPYIGHNWLKTDVIDRFEEGNSNYYVRQFPSILNPIFPKEEFERCRREMPPNKFRMYLMGEYCGVQGIVYPDMEGAFCGIPEGGMPESARFVGGIDFGGGSPTSDPFVAMAGMVDQDDRLWIIWEHRVTGTHNDINQNAYALRQWVDKLHDKTHCDIHWWADASRPESISILRKSGITVEKAPNKRGSVPYGIDLVTARLRTGRLKILSKEAQGLVEESKLYRYPIGTDEQAYGENPIDKHNDSMDALRYMVMGVDRNLSPITKSHYEYQEYKYIHG